MSSTPHPASLRRGIFFDENDRQYEFIQLINGSGLHLNISPQPVPTITEAFFKGIPLASAELLPGGLLAADIAPAKWETPQLFNDRQDENAARLSVSNTFILSRSPREKISVTRTILCVAGNDSIIIKDHITNNGSDPADIPPLCKIQLGPTLLDPSGYLSAPDHPVVYADNNGKWDRFLPSANTSTTEIYFHRLPADRDGFTHLRALLPAAGIKFHLSCRHAELPLIKETKCSDQNGCTLILEPLASMPKNQPDSLLPPGESREYMMILAIE